MDIFDQVKKAVDDFNLCQAAFRSAEKELRSVSDAVDERIKRDKAAYSERVKTLTAQSQDPARSAILRKLAGKELELIQEQGGKFGPSEGEIATFNAAYNDASEALREFEKIGARLPDLFEAAKKELRAMKNGTYVSDDPHRWRSSLESRWKDFKGLSESIKPVTERLEEMCKERYSPISDGLQYERP